jgi:hypothetical protein
VDSSRKEECLRQNSPVLPVTRIPAASTSSCGRHAELSSVGAMLKSLQGASSTGALACIQRLAPIRVGHVSRRQECTPLINTVQLTYSTGVQTAACRVPQLRKARLGLTRATAAAQPAQESNSWDAVFSGQALPAPYTSPSLEVRDVPGRHVGGCPHVSSVHKHRPIPEAVTAQQLLRVPSHQWLHCNDSLAPTVMTALHSVHELPGLASPSYGMPPIRERARSVCCPAYLRW